MAKKIEMSRLSDSFGNPIEAIMARFVRFRQLFAVISLYTILTVIFTYPVAFTSNAVAGPGGDGSFYLWDLWWFKQSVLSFSSPYFTPYIFHPSGLSLAFSTISPFNGFVSVPFQSIFSVVTIYNLLWLSSFIFAGIGTFYLVRYLTKNSYAAFISGLIFMFSPYHFAHALGHLSLLTIQWIPFYILFLLKTIRETGLKNSFLAAFFLFFVGLSDTTYLLYVLVFTVLLLFYYFVTERESILQKDPIIRLIITLTTFGIGFFPFAYPMLREFFFAKIAYLGFGGADTFSADLLGFITPSQLHPLFGTIVEPVYRNFTGNTAEFTTFAGFTVIFLVALAIIKIKNKEIKFWALSAGIFFVFSLGPVLHFNGIIMKVFDGFTFVVPLPYFIISKIPIISMARAPARWDVMVMLSLSILAGYGMTWIFDKYRDVKFFNRKISFVNIFSMIIIVMILFEFLAIPFPMTETRIPGFYYQLKQDPEKFAIFEVPGLIDGLSPPDYMYYQTAHEKYLLSGYTHISENEKYFMKNTPFIKDIYFESFGEGKDAKPQKDILNQNLTVGKSILNYYSIKYVILHENRMTADQKTIANTLLQENINMSFSSEENDTVRIYQVPKVPIESFKELTSGFSPLENWSGIPTRWIPNEGILTIYSDKNRTANLSFQASSFHRPRNLKIYLQNSLLTQNDIPENWVTITTPINLHQGENVFKLVVVGNCEKPIDITEINSTDTRCLTVAIQNISSD